MGGQSVSKLRNAASRACKWIGLSGALLGALGFVGGAFLFRADDTWLWAQSADWGQLPATAVGTSIPAGAGFMLARMLARDSARALTRAGLEETVAFGAAQAKREASEDVSRQASWKRLFEALSPLEHHPELTSDVDAVFTEKKAQLASVEAHAKLAVGVAMKLARLRISWRTTALRSMPQILTELDELIEAHGVNQLRPVAGATREFNDALAELRLWEPCDPEALITYAGQFDRATITYNEIYDDPIDVALEKARAAFADLLAAARLYRGVSHRATDVVLSTAAGGDFQSAGVDVNRRFTDLRDALSELPDWNVTQP